MIQCMWVSSGHLICHNWFFTGVNLVVIKICGFDLHIRTKFCQRKHAYVAYTVSNCRLRMHYCVNYFSFEIIYLIIYMFYKCKFCLRDIVITILLYFLLEEYYFTNACCEMSVSILWLCMWYVLTIPLLKEHLSLVPFRPGVTWVTSCCVVICEAYIYI